MADTFSELGYAIVKAQGTGPWTLREALYDACCEKLQEADRHIPGYIGRRSTDEWFDNFHDRELRGRELNNLRLHLQKTIQPLVGPVLFDSFPDIGQLIGPDVVQQRGCNLVIAQPGDSERAPTHRDAPLNSKFEVVCWTPMNDAHDTKSMRVLNLAQTKVALDTLRAEGYPAYKEYAAETGLAVEVPFGSALIFWAGLVHSIPINQTHETRWTIHHRFKNFWAPYGEKGSGYFTGLHLSPVTQIGLGAA